MKELRFHTLKELKENPPEPNNYLIDGFMWEGDFPIILGSDKAGKSILALQMACNLTSGTPFLGEYDIPFPMDVAFIQTEGKQDETIARLLSMTGTNGIPCDPARLHILCTHSWQLDQPEGYTTLAGLLYSQKIQPKVIFLDPLYMSMAGDLNDNLASRNMARNIRRLGEEFKATIPILHHQHREKRTPTGEFIEEGDHSIMGSFVWKAFTDHVLHLRKRPDNLRSITCHTARSGRVVEDMQLQLVTDPLSFKIVGTPDHMPYVDTVLDVMVAKKEPLCAEDVVKITKLSTSAVRKSLSYLQRANKIVKVNPGRRPVLYVYGNGGV